jgi:hypothetical protein
MRRICKRKDSPILQNNWVYKKNAAVYNRKIREVLEKEQSYFCAYTEERFNTAFAIDIEHFNPNLKYTERDSYKNWFAVSHKFNIEKSTKWEEYQPIMHPTDLNFNKRLWYEDGYYQVNSSDTKAYHLRTYLDLNNEALVQERKNYIKGLQEMQNSIDIAVFLQKNPDFVRFPTAIQTEFGKRYKTLPEK